MALTNDEAIRKFIELTVQKRTLKEALDHVQADLNELEPRILEDFTEQGRSKVTQNGSTVYLQKKVYAKVIGDESDEGGEARQRAALALKDAGPHWRGLVKEDFNTMSLTRAIKEYLDNNKSLPAIFDGVISTSEVFKVLVRKSGKTD